MQTYLLIAAAGLLVSLIAFFLLKLSGSREQDLKSFDFWECKIRQKQRDPQSTGGYR